LCMGKWIVGEKVAMDIVDRWLSAEIGQGFNKERKRVQARGLRKFNVLRIKISNKNYNLTCL